MTPSYSTGFLEAREGDGKHWTLEYRSGKSPGDSPGCKTRAAGNLEEWTLEALRPGAKLLGRPWAQQG